jgi:hypothetical protein
MTAEIIRLLKPLYVDRGAAIDIGQITAGYAEITVLEPNRVRVELKEGDVILQTVDLAVGDAITLKLEIKIRDRTPQREKK